MICASAGNHAQGVALRGASGSASSATIVMPRTTPAIKVAAVRARGGNAVIARRRLRRGLPARARRSQPSAASPSCHPYDDPDVIAGQGTVGMEILQQHPEPIEAIFVPIGGGGLAAGVAAFVKFLRPDVKVIGVEPDDAACMQAALRRANGSCSTRSASSPTASPCGRPGAETFRSAATCSTRSSRSRPTRSAPP